MFGIGKGKEKKETAACCCAVQPDSGRAQGEITVKVLGSGCMSCHALLENTQKAVRNMGKENEIRVEYVTDLEKIMGYGVMSMPALVINEKIASVGKVLRPAEIQDILGKCC